MFGDVVEPSNHKFGSYLGIFQYDTDDSYHLRNGSLIFESFKKSPRGAEESQKFESYAGSRNEFARNESGIQAVFI